MFVKPVKRSATFKKFTHSKHETISTSEDNRFALQKRKKQTAAKDDDDDDDDMEQSVLGSPSVVNRSANEPKKNWNFRIILLGNPYYEVAFSDELEKLKNREWRYVNTDLPKRIPSNLSEKELASWFVSHFTCLAMELSNIDEGSSNSTTPTGGASNTTTNASTFSPTTPSLTTSNTISTTTSAVSNTTTVAASYTTTSNKAFTPAQQHQMSIAKSEIINPIRNQNNDNVLIPTTTYPLYGFIPFVIVILLVNIPIMLLRDVSDDMFFYLIGIINIIVFLRVLCGWPSIWGLSTLLPYNKVYKPAPITAKKNVLASTHNNNNNNNNNISNTIANDSATAPTADQVVQDEQTDASTGTEAKSVLDILATPGGSTQVGENGFIPALSLKGAEPGEAQPNTYSDSLGQSWQLRTGPDYNINKKKAHSTAALFDLLGMDVFQSDKKIQHIARYVDFEPLYTRSTAPYINLGTTFDYTTQEVIEEQKKNPLPHQVALQKATQDEIQNKTFQPELQTLDTIPKYDFKPDPTGKVQPKGEYRDGFHFGTMDRPFIWIVNMQIPTYEPSYMNPVTDGKGMNLVWYLRATPETQRDLMRPEPISPAVRVLKKYVLANPSDPDYMHNINRFKNIPRLVNVSDFNLGWGVKSLVTQYNAKPFLTRPQGVLHRGPGYACFDLDIHSFCYTARKFLHGFLDKMDQVILDWCFCVEGYDNDELPEVSLSQIRLVKISYQSFPSWEATSAALQKVQTVGYGENDANPKTKKNNTEKKQQ